MNCSNCKYDLNKMTIYDNINDYHKCPNCEELLYLEYDEICYEDEYGFIICDEFYYWNHIKTIFDIK